MTDEALMRRAMELADGVRATTSPNPWVGAVVVTPDGDRFEGATSAAGRTARRSRRARPRPAPREPTFGVPRWSPRSSRAAITGAPHRAPAPCSMPVSAGWWWASRTPIRGRGPRSRAAARGRRARWPLGRRRAPSRRLLAPYLTHRRTGRPWVVLKLASTLDGRTAAADGTSQWITSPEVRADAHRRDPRATPSWWAPARSEPTTPR